MEEKERLKLIQAVGVLEDLAKEYPGRTIENVIGNLKARLDFYGKEV